MSEIPTDIICDKPNLFDHDSSETKPRTSTDVAFCEPKLSAIENSTLDTSPEIDASPHLLASDNTKTTSQTSTDTTHYKPYLFASDSSKKTQADMTYYLFSSESSKKAQADMTYYNSRSEASPFIMPENIRKRRSITVKEKLDILDMVDSGQKLSHVARKFGISSSTASTIVKERYKIKMLSDHYNIDPERKRMRLGIYRDVDEAVHLWFKQMRMKNIPINGPMFQQKAREFAVQLGHQNFEGSSGWLFRFRERHGLSVKTMRDYDDSNAFNCSGVGMTDDEIVTSVCSNTAHSLKYLFNVCDKDKTTKNNCKNKVNNKSNANKQDIPENYLVPEIELTDYEPVVSLPEAISLADKLTTFLKEHNAPSDILKSMSIVTDCIEKDIKNQMKQRKITDYFKLIKPE